MNWKEISEKHPKAWGSLLKWRPYIQINESKTSSYYGDLGWYFTDGVHSYMQMWASFKIRDLFDFFDENDIIVEISLLCQGFVSTISKNCEEYYVDVNRQLNSHKTRREAEFEAFEKAFEILESKL